MGEIGFGGSVARRTPDERLRLAPELAEQVDIFADRASTSLTYSDLYDHLLGGARSVRRLLPAGARRPRAESPRSH